MHRHLNLKKYSVDRPGSARKKLKSNNSCCNEALLENQLQATNNKSANVCGTSIDTSNLSTTEDENNSSTTQENFEHLNELGVKQFEDDKDNSLSFEKHLTFKQKLASWAIESNVSLKHLSELLKLLREDGNYCNLPQDARTLLCTPRKVPVTQMGNGQYIFIGIRSYLEAFFNYSTINEDVITLSISTDGTPVSASGTQSLWIIFGCLHLNTFSRQIFDVALYYGLSKPTSFNNFFKETVNELKSLIENGYTSQTGQKYKVKLKCIVADAPALASIKYVKSHGGYSSCTKCEIRGTYYQASSSVIYTQTDAPLRTDEKFRQRVSSSYVDDHHNTAEHTVLENLPIDMINDFPIDKMHLVDEGVVKRILLLLTIKVNRQKLPARKVTVLNERLQQCEAFMPLEFQRKPRSLKYVLRMKATEFRNFLLYTGPSVLNGVIPDKTYNHFLTLCLAIRILSSPLYYNRYNNYAKTLLEHVVKLFPDIYGKHNMTYNIHGLLHLADDVKRHGPLDSYSCYAFEAHIKHIKRMIRSPNMPIIQIYNRLKENAIIELTQQGKKLLNIEFSHQVGENKYHEAKYPTFTIKTNNKSDNSVMLRDNTIVRVHYFFKDKSGNPKFFMGQKLKDLNPLNGNECLSNFNMVVGNFDTQLAIFLADHVACKICCMPFNSTDFKYFCSPLIHSLS